MQGWRPVPERPLPEEPALREEAQTDGIFILSAKHGLLWLDEEKGKAETIDIRDEHVYDRLQEMTDDAVGCEAHSRGSVDAILDKAKQSVKLGTDRLHVMREAIYTCRKAGTVSIPGVYIGFGDKIPVGAFMNKKLTLKTGQTQVQRYMPKLLDLIRRVAELGARPGFLGHGAAMRSCEPAIGGASDRGESSSHQGVPPSRPGPRPGSIASLTRT